MSSITDENGIPIGSYDVFYYLVRDGRVMQAGGFDRAVSSHYVESLRLAKDEVAVARCVSQPGGGTFAGSQSALRGHSRPRSGLTHWKSVAARELWGWVGNSDPRDPILVVRVPGRGSPSTLRMSELRAAAAQDDAELRAIYGQMLDEAAELTSL